MDIAKMDKKQVTGAKKLLNVLSDSELKTARSNYSCMSSLADQEIKRRYKEDARRRQN